MRSPSNAVDREAGATSRAIAATQANWVGKLMALKSAEQGGLALPDRLRTDTLRYLESVSSGRHGGLARYQPHRPVNRTMTAEALYCRELLGELTETQADEAAAYVLEETARRWSPRTSTTGTTEH